ncbi:hypothetical protein CB0940_00979 [Cercospora beticola]|uniref:F-box domain-containing protein n=1 Tax=Cercospora beticola TaxID=122368 RepID=A0A2G5I8X5_CERBT|nr:hypothetical protein CB0940_00979 [Cercospora beticola]PIB00923.1 hypothetical protein CB0940_00979 [Cercospora beticola]
MNELQGPSTNGPAITRTIMYKHDESEENQVEGSKLGAGHKVAHIYELLEQILLSVAPRDLLVSQKVCVAFRDIIIGNPRIRTNFLMTLDEFSETSSWPNPMPSLFRTIEMRWCYSAIVAKRRLRYVLVQVDSQELLSGKWKQDGSWRNMLLTTAYLQSIRMHIDGKSRDFPVKRNASRLRQDVSPMAAFDCSCEWGTNTTDYPVGIKLGDLADLAHEFGVGGTVQFSAYLSDHGKALSCVEV